MASTYVNDLRLNEMATGDASGSWGTVTNTNLELIGEAFSYGTETIGDADSTLTIADGAADAARSFYLKITSSVDLTTTRIVTLGPNTVSKVWMIENATTGSQVITIKQGSGATINVPNGQVKMISTDGAGSGGAVLDLLVDVDLTGTTTLVNLDVSGTLGVTGVLTATSLDISGDIDVDGTTNLDVVDIDGAVDMASTLLVTGVLTTTAATVSNGGGQFNGAINVGVDDTGYDVKFFGATTGKSLLWDESADSLIVTGTTTLVGTTNLDAVDIDGATQIDATVTVGVNDTGYDVKFFGATAGAYMLWDESADDLILGGAAGLSVNSTALVTGVLTTTAVPLFNGGIDLPTVNTFIKGGGHNVVQVDSTKTYLYGGTGGVQFRTADNASALIDISNAGILSTVTAGTSNFRAGVNAGDAIASGADYNVIIGDEAGTDLNSGDRNVAVGYNAMFDANSAEGCVAIGAYAMRDATSGTFNIAIGNGAMLDGVVTGNHNLAIGYLPLENLTGGIGNIALGREALETLTVGNNNVAVGSFSLEVVNSSENTAVGNYSGQNNTTTDQVFIGYEAGQSTTSGAGQTFVGHNAGKGTGTALTGTNNTAVGRDSGLVLQGNAYSNSFFGANAGTAVTTGVQNTFIGYTAGAANTVAADNVAVGFEALLTESGGQNSVAIGPRALRVQSNGSGNKFNTAVGSNAGVAISTGGSNVCLGGQTGATLTTGSSNTLVGTSTNVDTAARAGATALGAGVGTHAADNSFRVLGSGGVYNTGNTSAWNTTSDERIKKNITDSTVGLAEINQIRVRNFEYRTADEITDSSLQEYDLEQLAIAKTGTQVGCIAQELKQIIPSAVIVDDRGVNNVQDDEIKWHMIKAVQELSTALDAALARIATLEGA
jgi:hypothetical protein